MIKKFEDFLNESNEEEKYFIWTDKTGRGEKPITLAKTQIEESWDLDEIDDDDVPLSEYLEECYIDDVWETRTEKLICNKIY